MLLMKFNRVVMLNVILKKTQKALKNIHKIQIRLISI